MQMVISREVRKSCLCDGPNTERVIDLTSAAIPTGDCTELLKAQRQLASAWSEVIPSFPTAKIQVLPSIEHAVQEIDKLEASYSGPVKVLVAGSLHLVGGVIEVAKLSDAAL